MRGGSKLRLQVFSAGFAGVVAGSILSKEHGAGAASNEPIYTQQSKPLGIMPVYYSRCAEAREAGVAPILRGQPGYREGLDGDADGIACEPYHR